MKDGLGLNDAMHAALDMCRSLPSDNIGIRGYGIADLRDGDGKQKLLVPFANLITTVGDEYYAKKACGDATLTLIGMVVGTGTTTPAKSGTYAGLETAGGLSNAYQAFYGTSPDSSAKGSDVGWYVTYVTQWAAGNATGSLNEVCIVDSNTTFTASHCIARAKFSSTVVKAAGDSLTVTWNHLFFGA
jgi:hypothetical protein